MMYRKTPERRQSRYAYNLLSAVLSWPRNYILYMFMYVVHVRVEPVVSF